MEELDLLGEDEQFTHMLQLEDAVNDERLLGNCDVIIIFPPVLSRRSLKQSGNTLRFFFFFFVFCAPQKQTVVMGIHPWCHFVTSSSFSAFSLAARQWQSTITESRWRCHCQHLKFKCETTIK